MDSSCSEVGVNLEHPRVYITFLWERLCGGMAFEEQRAN